MITLGIDCGTQSTKTVALDWETGAILASAQKAYGFVPGLPDGHMEQEPRDWVDAAEQTVTQVLAALGSRRGEVAAIGVSGQQHGLVVLDAQGEVIRPAKLWCDTSTTAQCAEITAALGGPETVVSLVGNSMRPGYTAPKILWLRQNEPEHWKRTATVLLPHDYLNFWLTGEKRMEYGDASGTALLDIRSRQWSGKVVDFIACDLAAKLPPLSSSRQPHGLLRRELREKWNLGEVTISAGGGDNMMAAIGTGNVHVGAITASLGTSGTLFAFSESPVIDPTGEAAGFCDSTDYWLPLICTMNVTLVTEHVRKLFGWDFAQFEEQIRSVPAGSGGLTLLPYLTGERTPDLPNGTGVLHGITLNNFTPAHLARVAMESATLGLAYGMERFKSLGLTPAEVRLTGGGSNSKIWRQLCADIFGVPTVCLQLGEGAGLGAAIQAGWTLEQDASLTDICSRLVRLDESTRALPDQANTALYADILAKTSATRHALQTACLL